MKKLGLVALVVVGMLILVALTPGGSMFFHLDGCFDDKIPGKYSLEKEGSTYEIILDESYTGSLKINDKTMGEFTWEVEDASENILLHGRSDLFNHLRKLVQFNNTDKPSHSKVGSDYQYFGISSPVCYLGTNKRLFLDYDLFIYFEQKD